MCLRNIKYNYLLDILLTQGFVNETTVQRRKRETCVDLLCFYCFVACSHCCAEQSRIIDVSKCNKDC